MKWETAEPSRNSLSYGAADQLVDHAHAQGMAVRGHTLVWHSQLPGWVENISSRTELLDVMRNHISNVAGHFRGDLEYWDVAFRAARTADPGAELCYNDYNIDGRNAKSDAVHAMVQDFKRRGVPIDCVGLQAHLIVGSVPGDVQAAAPARFPGRSGGRH